MGRAQGCAWRKPRHKGRGAFLSLRACRNLRGLVKGKRRAHDGGCWRARTQQDYLLPESGCHRLAQQGRVRNLGVRGKLTIGQHPPWEVFMAIVTQYAHGLQLWHCMDEQSVFSPLRTKHAAVGTGLNARDALQHLHGACPRTSCDWGFRRTTGCHAEMQRL